MQNMYHHILLDKVREYASKASEARQLANRLKELLPSRFDEIKRRLQSSASGSAHLNRLALADEGLQKHIDELVEVRFLANSTRVQYETHTMLINARKSLRRSDRSTS